MRHLGGLQQEASGNAGSGKIIHRTDNEVLKHCVQEPCLSAVLHGRLLNALRREMAWVNLHFRCLIWQMSVKLEKPK